MQNKPALCLDLDGTVRRSKTGTFIKDENDIELMPGIEAIIRRYKEKGYLILGISNQGGVAYGYKTVEQVNKELMATAALFSGKHPFDRVEMTFSMEGAPIEQYNRRSLLRKPAIGMLAVCEYTLMMNDIAIDWDKSIFVGDREEDEQCASNAGIRFIHIDNFLKQNDASTI